jgi:hypothetical protein
MSADDVVTELWGMVGDNDTREAALYLERNGSLLLYVNDGGDVGEITLSPDQAFALETALREQREAR